MEIIGSRAYVPDDIRACLQFVADKKIHPVIDQVFPLAQAADGLRLLEERRVFGKVIIEI
jgi:alcohol dehydrogenase